MGPAIQRLHTPVFVFLCSALVLTTPQPKRPSSGSKGYPILKLFFVQLKVAKFVRFGFGVFHNTYIIPEIDLILNLIFNRLRDLSKSLFSPL